MVHCAAWGFALQANRACTPAGTQSALSTAARSWMPLLHTRTPCLMTDLMRLQVKLLAWTCPCLSGAAHRGLEQLQPRQAFCASDKTTQQGRAACSSLFQRSSQAMFAASSILGSTPGTNGMLHSRHMNLPAVLQPSASHVGGHRWWGSSPSTACRKLAGSVHLPSPCRPHQHTPNLQLVASQHSSDVKLKGEPGEPLPPSTSLRSQDSVDLSANNGSAPEQPGQPSSTPAPGTPGAPPAVPPLNGAGVLKLPAGYASSITSRPPQAPEEKGLPHRWKVVIMMAVAFVLCNMDKVNMSVAVIPMAHELGWSALDRGLVSSSFFWGYTLTQLPGGYIATKVGGAKVLAAGVALWSFGTLIAPPAAQISLLALCASRVLVGLGEGVAPSAATTVLARLMPANERARAVSLVWGGLDIGSAVGLLLSGPLIRCYGWHSVFYLFAVLGLLWCIAWPSVKPEKLSNTTLQLQMQQQQQQQQQLAAQGQDPAKLQSGKLEVPWGDFFRSPPVWAVTVAHFCFNWGYYALLAWLPSYFELALGLNVEKSSILTLIPYVAMTCMMPLVGPIADGMVDRGVPLTWVRKICQGIAFIGPAACMIACAMLTPQTAAVSLSGVAAAAAPTQVPVAALVALMSLAFALSAWSRAGLYCNHQDLSPKYAGTLLGITNTAGALPGVLGVAAAGYLLDTTNSWALALFYPTAACQLFGALVYSIFASSERQSWS